MAHVIGRVFSAAALILLISSTQVDTCPANLTNRIVHDGDPNVLQVYNTTTYPKWSVLPASDPFSGLNDINDNGTVYPSLRDAYAVNVTGLVILKATTSSQGSSPISTAGLYQVEYAPSNCKSAAKLVVIQDDPVCGCAATTDFTQIQLSCTIYYADAYSIDPLQATHTWTMNGAYYTTKEPEPSSSADSYSYTSTSIITVDNTNDVYQCQVTFMPSKIRTYDFMATNTPTYNETCDAKCACPNNLTNMVVQEDDMNVLEVYNTTAYAKWSVFPSSDQGSGLYAISNGGTVDPSLRDAYAANITGLVILKATTSPKGNSPISTAGLYQVEFGPSNCKSAAKLVVIQGAPECWCAIAPDPTQRQLSCRIIFGDASTVGPITPIMTLTKNGQPHTTDEPMLSSNADGNIFTLTSTSTVDITDDVYQWQVTFSSPDPGTYDFIATNAPTYNETCDAKCVCPKNLTNMVVQEGDMNVLEVYNTTAYTKWSVFPSSDQGSGLYAINNDGTVDPSLSDAYAANIRGLVILKATTSPKGNSPISTAGLYQVEFGPLNCKSAAKLVVIQGAPECRCAIAPDPTQWQLSCNITFGDSSTVAPITPIMTLTKNGQPHTTDDPMLSSNSDGSIFTLTSSSTVDITNDVYQWQVTFSSPDASAYDFIAMNAPTYNETCVAECPCPANLTNRVVKEGDTNVLEKYKTANYSNWNVFTSSDASSIRYSINNYDSTVDPSLTGAYAVNITGLIILNATTSPLGNIPISMAGLYLVEYAPSHCISACKLVIISQGPLCFCNKSNGMRKSLFCVIRFADYRYAASIHPIVTWIKDGKSDSQEQPTQEPYDDYTFVSTSEIRIDNDNKRNDESTYQCQVTFSTPDPSPYDFIATNAPDYKKIVNCSDCSG